MTTLTVNLLIFLAVSAFFIFFHLMLGKLVRPARPHAEKLTIYECGEPTIGSAWIQFDLRFYVVALLFVIFDVEVVFFFPWAVVFGKANVLAREDLDPNDQAAIVQRQRLTGELIPAKHLEAILTSAAQRGQAAASRPAGADAPREGRENADSKATAGPQPPERPKETGLITSEGARKLALLTFFDIVVFFAVLLVGFAYLWKRGDLDWVRSTAAEQAAGPSPG